MDDGLLFECPFQRGDRELGKWQSVVASAASAPAINGARERGRGRPPPTECWYVVLGGSGGCKESLARRAQRGAKEHTNGSLCAPSQTADWHDKPR